MSFNEKEVTYKKQMVIQRNSDLIKKKLLEKMSLDRIHGICKTKQNKTKKTTQLLP